MFASLVRIPCADTIRDRVWRRLFDVIVAVGPMTRGFTMQPRTLVRLCCAAIAGMTMTTTSHAASLEIDDSTPGELTFVWKTFQFNAAVTAPASSPFTPDGSWTVPGETASFFGDWSTSGALVGSGVIYIVDPVQTELIRARIDATWTNSFGDTQFDTLDVTSTPFGSDLGILPAAFAGLGVPMPDGAISIESLFRDPILGLPIGGLENISIVYIGDLVPECPHPTLVQFPPSDSFVSLSDLDTPDDFEQAETIIFSQDVIVRSLRWWGEYLGAGTIQADADDFELRVYEDDGGLPDMSSVATFHLSNAVRAGTEDAVFTGRFVYAATLPSPMTLKANTQYWLVIINNTVADPDDQWWWSGTDAGDNLRGFRDQPNTGVWGVTSFDQAYELCGNASSLDCPTDLDGDGLTSGADLAQLLANWGPCGPPLPLMVPLDPSDRFDMLSSASEDPEESGVSRK